VLHQIGERDREFVRDQLEPYFDINFVAEAHFLNSVSHPVRAEAIFSRIMTRKMLSGFEGLEFIQTPGTGLDGLDLEAIAGRQIQVANSHSAAPYIAEHAVALLFSALKKIPQIDQRVRKSKPTAGIHSNSLQGKTVGIAGFGHVGQKIAALLSGFDVEILCLRRRKERVKLFDGKVKQVGLNELLAQLDILFICLPLTRQTLNLFGSAELSKLKPNSYLVNVGRAEVIQRSALLEALSEDKLAGLAMDVWWPDEDPFASFVSDDRVILSPHRAGSDEDGPTYLRGAVESLGQFARREPLENLVDLSSGY